MSAWTQFFDELDRIFHQTAQLLKDGDALLGEQGYACVNGTPNYVGTESSSSIQKPGQWYPRWMVRFYAGDEGASKETMAFLAVFLSDEAGHGDWASPPSRMEEPLVVAGVIEGHPGKEIKWDYWICKWWFWSEDAEVGGKISQVKPDPPRADNWKRMHTFAIPLAKIDSLAKLKENVADQLVRLLDEHAKASGRPTR